MAPAGQSHRDVALRRPGVVQIDGAHLDPCQHLIHSISHAVAGHQHGGRRDERAAAEHAAVARLHLVEHHGDAGDVSGRGFCGRVEGQGAQGQWQVAGGRRRAAEVAASGGGGKEGQAMLLRPQLSCTYSPVPPAIASTPASINEREEQRCQVPARRLRLRLRHRLQALTSSCQEQQRE